MKWIKAEDVLTKKEKNEMREHVKEAKIHVEAIEKIVESKKVPDPEKENILQYAYTAYGDLEDLKDAINLGLEKED